MNQMGVLAADSEAAFRSAEPSSSFPSMVAGYADLLKFLSVAPVGLIKFRPDGAIDMANRKAVQLLMPIAPDAELSNVFLLFAKAIPDLRARISARGPVEGQIVDDTQLPVPRSQKTLTVGVHRVDSGTLMAVVQDITAAVEQETCMRDDQKRFREITDTIRDYAIYTVDSAGCVESWNRSLERLGGWEAADVVGASIDMFFAASYDGRPPAETLLDRASEDGKAEFEGHGLRRDGSRFWSSTIVSAVLDEEGEACGYVLVTRDLSGRKQAEDRRMALASTDPLTGAYNRHAGASRLQAAFSRWQQHGRSFAVLMVDVDHFQSIKERWGQETGDHLLMALVQMCRDTLRGSDVAIRWGGEEFLLLLSEAGGVTAFAVAERVRLAVASIALERGAETVGVTLSVGIASCAGGDADADDVVRRAEIALDRARHSGRNRIVPA